MTTQNLLVELFVEELPPKALKKLGAAFGAVLLEQLVAQGAASAESTLTCFASPRRLAAHITRVLEQAPDHLIETSLMPVTVGLLPSGQMSPALIKKLTPLKVPHDVPLEEFFSKHVVTVADPKGDKLMLRRWATGYLLRSSLQSALEVALERLPIPKVMTYQLESGCELPGWSSVSFVRPAQGLVALPGAEESAG